MASTFPNIPKHHNKLTRKGITQLVLDFFAEKLFAVFNHTSPI